MTAGFNTNPITYNIVPFLPVSPKLRTIKFSTITGGQYYTSVTYVTGNNVQKINTSLSAQILFVDGRFATAVPLQYSYF